MVTKIEMKELLRWNNLFNNLPMCPLDFDPILAKIFF